MARHPWRAVLCALLILALAACSNSEGADSAPPTPTATDRPTPTIPRSSPDRNELIRELEQLRIANESLSQIWESLASGGQARCDQTFLTLSPDAISAGDDYSIVRAADLLREAAIEIRYAQGLWQGECANPRANVPADMIDQGRLAVRAAGDALEAAAHELSQ